MSNSLIERAAGRLRGEGRRIQKKIEDRLVQLNEDFTMSRASRIQRTGLERTRQAITLLIEDGTAQAELWEGPEQNTGRTLRVAYLSDSHSFKVNSPQYLRHILFQPESARIASCGDYPRNRPREKAEALAHAADLVIFEGNALRGWHLAEGTWRWAPTWLRMMWYFQPGITWEEIERCMHGQKTNIKRVQKRQYGFRFSTDEADFEYFYERMHKPMVAERHTRYGYVDRKESLRDHFRHGGLFLISTPAGQTVAGGLALLQSRSAFGIVNGILDGDQHWNEEGAVSALYYYSIRWCYDQGLACYDAGGVRPFANDGLYLYKQRWGAQPTNDLWNERRWLFWAPNCAPVAIDWLAAHPLVNVRSPAHEAVPATLMAEQPGPCDQHAVPSR